MKPATPVLKQYPKQTDLEDAGLEYHVIAKHQLEYDPLCSVVSASGVVTTRWELSWLERLRVLFGGSVYLQVLTFNRPLQPVKLLIQEPTSKECQ